jgi:flagellar biogenesis protein FliO
MTRMGKTGSPGRNTRRWWLILVGLLWCLSTAATWAAEPSVVGEPALQPPGIGLSVVRLLGAFVLVVSIALGAVWLLRNGARFAPRSRVDRTLKVLEMRMLGGRQSLVVVGYEDQRMLLATSPAGVSFLCRLPAAAGIQAAGEPDLAPTFMDALSTAVGQSQAAR